MLPFKYLVRPKCCLFYIWFDLSSVKRTSIDVKSKVVHGIFRFNMQADVLLYVSICSLVVVLQYSNSSGSEEIVFDDDLGK